MTRRKSFELVSYSRKQSIVKMVGGGLSQGAVVSHFGMPRTTVIDIFKHMELQGGLCKSERCGRRIKLSERSMKKLMAYAKDQIIACLLLQR